MSKVTKVDEGKGTWLSPPSPRKHLREDKPSSRSKTRANHPPYPVSEEELQLQNSPEFSSCFRHDSFTPCRKCSQDAEEHIVRCDVQPTSSTVPFGMDPDDIDEEEHTEIPSGEPPVDTIDDPIARQHTPTPPYPVTEAPFARDNDKGYRIRQRN
uniref:Uncharacterized protein n=1 Tax=Schistocephalus solidus TaxID=70667 RepID=A0A0X3P855_SCHSO